MRLLLLRFQKFGIILLVVGVTTAAGVYNHKNGIFEKAQNWVAAKTLSVTASAGFRVGNILIKGRERTPDAVLLENLGVKQGDAIFGVDIALAQATLSEISWVKDVSVTRRLPDTIAIELTERKPVALWQYQKKISVIDITGRVLASDNLGAYKTLPLVVGDSAPEHIKEFLDLMRAEPEVAAVTDAAIRIGGRRWDLKLKNGVTVKLPETDTELALRKLAVQKARHGLLDKNIVSIDLRIPEQLVVQGGKPADTGLTKKTI